MSFSFTASGSPREVIAEVGRQAAQTPQIPQRFADALNEQLHGLPAEAEVTLSTYGHTGWQENATSGQISLHATADVRLVRPASAEAATE
jgi:hypothetical protein